MEQEKDIEVSYEGSVVGRLFSYLKPYKLTMAGIFLLVLLITFFELYRPIIIGNAIDRYINGYNTTYGVVDQDAEGAVLFQGTYISKTWDKGQTDQFWQIVLFQDHYFLFQNITEDQAKALKQFDKTIQDSCKWSEDTLTLETEAVSLNGVLLEKEDLKVLRKTDFQGILMSAALYFAILILNYFCNRTQTIQLQKTGQSIIYHMRQEIFTHMHTLSLGFFNNTPVGKLVTRVTNDTEALNEMYSTVLVRMSKNIIKIIGFAVVMLSIHVRLAVYSFLMLPLVALFTYIFRKVSKKAYRITRNKITDLNTFLSEHLSGMKLIQIFAKEKEKYEEFEGKSIGLFRAAFREVLIFAVFRPGIYMLSIGAVCIILYTGSSAVLTNAISIGTLFIFINYISSFFEPIQDMADQFSILQSSIASAEKIFTVLDLEPDIKNPEQPVNLTEVKGKIEFKHVWFAYEGDDYILKDVSFTILPGEKVAFVGETGAGKSSILNLIGRYYDIQKGEILIDGVDIKSLDTDQLRGSIGQVQQDVFIFTGDIKSNIRLRQEEITREQVKNAAAYVNATSFIEKMPAGFDELVTERGSTLSAGQRQLLSFARTLAFSPRILVMDEATANIDTETELLIQEALEKLMTGRTTIMVAHRLSTIQHADNIIVMQKGQVKESGTHQELLVREGIYKKLYDLQLA